MKDEKLLKHGVDILMEKLGSIETSRFLSFPPQKKIESVKRHLGKRGQVFNLAE